MIAYLLALTFTPCPRPIDAPPIRLTIINTQTPGIECARRAATPIDAAILTMAAGCAMDGLIIIPMDGPAQLLALARSRRQTKRWPRSSAYVAAVAAWRFMTNSEGVRVSRIVNGDATLDTRRLRGRVADD